MSLLHRGWDATPLLDQVAMEEAVAVRVAAALVVLFLGLQMQRDSIRFGPGECHCEVVGALPGDAPLPEPEIPTCGGA